MNTDDEGSCAQFIEWHIWKYKLLWFVYTLKILKKKSRKEKKKNKYTQEDLHNIQGK